MNSENEGLLVGEDKMREIVSDESQENEKGEAESSPAPEDNEEEVVTDDGETIRVSSRVAKLIQSLRVAPTQHPQAPSIQPNPESTVSRIDPEEDIEKLWYSDPKLAYKKIKETVKEEIRKEYQVDQNVKQFWSDFNKENPSLKEHQEFAMFLMNKNLDQLGDMPIARARGELAKMVKKELGLRVQNSGEKPKTVLGSGSKVSEKVAKVEDDTGFSSLSEAIRLRRKRLKL